MYDIAYAQYIIAMKVKSHAKFIGLVHYPCLELLIKNGQLTHQPLWLGSLYIHFTYIYNSGGGKCMSKGNKHRFISCC